MKMRFKRIIAGIMMLAVCLATVNISALVHAGTEAYQVSFREPAIPMDEFTILNLSDIEVQLTEDGDYINGVELLWYTSTNDSSKFILNVEDGTITAYQRGTYALTAVSAAGVSKTIYLSVKEAQESAWPIYETNFADYQELYNVNLDTYASSDYQWVTYPDGWTGQIRKNTYQASPAYSDLPGLAPYTTSAIHTSDNYYQAQTTGPGVVPFNNNKGNESANYGWLGFGYFTLTDDIVNDFYDFTVNAQYKAFDNSEDVCYRYGSGLFGRIPTEEGKLTNTLTDFWVLHVNLNTSQNNAVSLVNHAYATKNSSGMWDIDSTRECDFDNDGNADGWEYLADKQSNFYDTTLQPSVSLSVKYEGTTATVYSPEDESNTVFSYSVADGIGSVGVATTHVGAGSYTLPSWINIQNFGVYLNNLPEDKPVTTEIDLFEVSYDYPAILMNVNTKAELSYMAFQLSEGGSYILGSAIDWSTDETSGNLILNNSDKFVATTATGTYPILATYGEESRIFYVVAKEASDSDFYLVNDDYTNGDSGDWIVFDGSTDVAFTKSDTTVSASGGAITMLKASDASAFLYNEDALLEFSDYTVEVDALCDLSDGGFWHRFGIIGRSNEDVSQNFSMLLRCGYGVNFMNSAYTQSLFTASLKDDAETDIKVNYHHFHTLSEEERGKLYPVDEQGTGEYTLTTSERAVYSVKYSGEDLVYSVNGNVVFDSANKTVADEWDARYRSSAIEISLANDYVVVEDTESWWDMQFAEKGVNAGGYAGILVNDAKAEVYGFRVKLHEHTMAPATDYDPEEDKEEIYIDESFNSDDVILRFGVVSDIHISGSWHQVESSAKWAHAIKSLQQMAKVENATLDAILVNGDMVDSIAGVSNVLSLSSYGTKAYQNWMETNNFANGLRGVDNGGYGIGLGEDTQLFYSLGNHDETGEGWAKLTNYDDVHTAAYYIAVLCGWQYGKDFTDITGKTTASTLNDQVDNSYQSFTEQLMDYYLNPETTQVTEESFKTEFGVNLDSAVESFETYYGVDSDYESLLSGNRHAEINGIHFLAVELTQSDASCEWAEKKLEEITTAEDYNNQPVFVLTHVKLPSDDMPGVEDEYGNLQQVVSKYPQVIIWGGHSHSFLHNDSALETSNGYTQVESATTEYVTLSDLTYTGASKHSGVVASVENVLSQHSHAFSNGCYVEVDADYNVRIRRIDLYQSYSEDYKDTTVQFTDGTSLYQSSVFAKYGSDSYAAEWCDTYVEIREPWIISTTTRETTDALKNYTIAKRYNNNSPKFATENSLVVKGSVNSVKASFVMNATDDGMVHNYVLELYEAGSDACLERHYFTNYFYLYCNSSSSIIPVISEQYTFTMLNEGTEYTVRLYAVDDYGVSGQSIVQSATTFTGSSVKNLEDNRTAVYVDATTDAYAYTDSDGETYFTYENMETALAANPDIVYFLAGVINVWDVYDYSKALEIVGINEDRSKVIMSFATFAEGTYPYQNPLFEQDISFKNMTFDVSGACEGESQTAFESYMFYGSSNMVLDSVAIIPGSDGNGLQIGPVRNSQVEGGSLTVKGDTGPFYRISYSAANYWGKNSNYVDGNLTVNLEGGTYHSQVGYTGYDTWGAINGNLFLNISGGTFNGEVSMLGGQNDASENTQAVFQNAVARISGGVFGENGLGQTGATYISGREIYIVENHMLLNDTTLANGNPFYLTSEDTILIKVEDAASVGDAVYDENGVITAFAIVQREGYESYVNGELSETVTVEAGGNYTINFRLKEDVAKQMLDVLVQDNSQTAEEHANTFDIRFISSLDDENNYENAGFVFSLSNDMPCIDGTASVVRYTNKLYKSIMADGTEETVQEVYGSFSNYMFAFEITNVLEETTIYVRSFLTMPDNEVIYGEVREIVAPTSDNTQAVRNYRISTEARITEIQNTTSDIVPVDGATAYYFSNDGSSSNDGKSEDTPLATLEDLHALELQEGDVVYFERGSLWRGTIIAQTGVTYTSYGEGAKPMFYASPENGAEEDKWTEVQDNIWQYQTTIQVDVGGIVFDEGEHWGIKKIPVDDGNGVMVDNATREEFAGYEDLKNNYDFYYDLTDNQLYLYYDTGNPGTLFTSIEFCTNASVIDLRANVDNVEIDNLCIKYAGQMGITSNSIYEGLSITNCEFGWIGGSLMYPGTSPTRYGNAIQIWGSANNFVVDNCYFYQIYDAGVTWQYSNSEAIAKIADGVTISNNVMDYCTYSIEYFFSEGDIAECYMKNIEFSGNDMWFSGEGFGEQRPKSSAAHIKSWTHNNNIASDGDFNITDNIFAFSKENLLETYSVTGISPAYSGNVYIQYEDGKLGFTGDTSTKLDFTVSNVQDAFGDENAKVYIIKK